MSNTTQEQSCHLPARRRAKSSGVFLTESDAALVKGMLARGDRAHDIASFFGVNSARVADVAAGKTFVRVAIAAENELPPPGPYLAPLSAQIVLGALVQATEALERAQQLISKRPS